VIGFWNPLYALVALALGFFGLFPPILGFLKRMGQSKADKSKRQTTYLRNNSFIFFELFHDFAGAE
jgi:hypothetical protein